MHEVAPSSGLAMTNIMRDGSFSIRNLLVDGGCVHSKKMLIGALMTPFGHACWSLPNVLPWAPIIIC